MGKVVIFLSCVSEKDCVQTEFLSAASLKYKVLPLPLFNVVLGETWLIIFY